MSNSKISALTSATTPLAGTETLPVVQSSTTKQVSVANLTAGRAVSALTYNGLTLTAAAAGYTIAGGTSSKTLTVNNTIALSGTDSTTMTFPSTSATIARTDATQTFAADQNVTGTLTATYLRANNASGTAQVTARNVNDYFGWYVQSGQSKMFFYDFYNGIDLFNVSSSTKDLTLNAGNIVPGTAAKGINFTANTPAAGMTSQLLNWYEEGTWTPVVSGTGTAGTYQLAAGTVATYTRIGRQVTINASIVLAAAITGGGTGSLKITGLPFAKASGQQAPGVFGGYSVDFDASVLYASTFFSTTASSSTLLITQYKDNTAYALLPITAIAANSEMYISVTYFA